MMAEHMACSDCICQYCRARSWKCPDSLRLLPKQLETKGYLVGADELVAVVANWRRHQHDRLVEDYDAKVVVTHDERFEYGDVHVRQDRTHVAMGWKKMWMRRHEHEQEQQLCEIG